MEMTFREVVEAGYAAFARGDLEFLLDHADPAIEIVEPPDLPGATTHRGHDGFLRALDNWAGQWDEFRVDIERVIEAGPERVIVFARHHGRGKSSGAVVDARNVNVHTGRNGKLIRWEIFRTLDEAFAAIGLRKLKGES
jgi:ketosteroid isomerase-like protein